MYTLIPAGKNPDEFMHKLGRRFKNVCSSETRVDNNYCCVFYIELQVWYGILEFNVPLDTV